MSGILADPLPADTRSSLADWLELSTFVSSRGRSTESTILSLLDLAEDTALDPAPIDDETGEKLDEAILGEDRGQIITAVFDELAYRARCLGESYPFSLVGTGTTLDRISSNPSDHVGQLIYLFCLLASAIREGRLHPDHTFKTAEQKIAAAFQVCACLAAGGYIVGEVASFGFPRATGTGFLPALRDVYKRFGTGQVRGEIPEGLPESLKDGGIDVIAWRDLPDDMPGKFYLLGQCASGLGWKKKSVVENIPQLHGGWFVQPPATHSVPAMFIPFPIHHELGEPREVSFSEKIRNWCWFHEQRFGIIFDRLRIAHFANACMNGPEDIRKRLMGQQSWTWCGTGSMKR